MPRAGCWCITCCGRARDNHAFVNIWGVSRTGVAPGLLREYALRNYGLPLRFTVVSVLSITRDIIWVDASERRERRRKGISACRCTTGPTVEAGMGSIICGLPNCCAG